MGLGWTTAPLRPPIALGGVLAFALIGSPAARAEGPEYPIDRLGVRTAPILFLSRADVRAELRLSPAQAAAADQAIADLRKRAEALRGKSGPETVAARAAIDQDMQRWIDTQLSADQRKRLAQIDLQWEGPTALHSRPMLADSLNLSPAQRKALAQAVADRDQRRRQHGPKPEDEHLLFDRARSILSAEQQERWRAMLGPPFVPQVANAEPNRPR